MFGIKNSLIKKSIIVTLSSLLYLVLAVTVYASVDSPSFPSCPSKIFDSRGDWASYASGLHGIPGVGNLEGSDDVYSLNSGNFLQCFCPAEGDNGIQSNWWNVQRDELSEDEINELKNNGWMEENGSGWNLYNETYLVKNQNFSCAIPTPTPTVVPSVTPTPTPSTGGTTSEAGPPICSAPAVTVAPLFSRANLTRIDSDSVKISWIVTDSNAQRYGIHYGTSPENLNWYTEVNGHDTKEVTLDSVPSGNIYFNVCSIGACGDAKCGGSVPTVLGATSELPATGAAVLILSGFAPLGVYLFRRFRLN